MASNDNNGKRMLEEEAETSAARKRIWLSDDNGGDDDSSDSQDEDTVEEEETEDEVSSDESLLNQFDASEDKLAAKHGRELFFGDDCDTTSPSSEPCTPETPSSRMHSDPDGSDDGDIWM
jgi:hypothetical protein